MTKSLIISSLKKVFLNLKGIDDPYIFWDLIDNKLTLRSYGVAFKSSVFSTIAIDGVNMGDSHAVLRDPERLLKLLEICQEEILLTIEKKRNHKLIIKDATYEQDFILADPDVIKLEVEKIEEPLSYDFILPVDVGFIHKFLAAKKANGASVVSVEIKDRKAKFEIGETDSHYHKTKFFIEQDGMFDMPKLLFSSDTMQAVFERNKNCTGTLYVCADGLMKLSFKETIGESTTSVDYFLIALDLI